MSLWTYIKNLVKAIFGIDIGEKTTPTVQPPTTTKPKRTYATLTINDEGIPVVEGGRRYYLDTPVINYMLTLETDLTVKSEIRTLIKEKEAEGINAYSFETKLGRYEVVNGTFKRYPKTN